MFDQIQQLVPARLVTDQRIAGWHDKGTGQPVMHGRWATMPTDRSLPAWRPLTGATMISSMVAAVIPRTLRRQSQGECRREERCRHLRRDRQDPGSATYRRWPLQPCRPLGSSARLAEGRPIGRESDIAPPVRRIARPLDSARRILGVGRALRGAGPPGPVRLARLLHEPRMPLRSPGYGRFVKRAIGIVLAVVAVAATSWRPVPWCATPAGTSYGSTSHSFDAARTIWEFLSRHSLAV